MFKAKILRCITCVLLLTFSYTFIFYETIYGISLVVEDINKAKLFLGKLDGFVLPYRLGRIVEKYNNGNNVSVVLIQDLHCHPEVQKNIFEIIKLLDEKFDVEKIFVEGAPKTKVETILFSSISDKSLQKLTLDNLLNSGLISGAEYYEALYTTGKLYGIEDWEVYLANYERIKKLLQEKYKNLENLNILSNKVKMLKRKYLSKKIKKLEEVISDKNRFYDNIEKLLKKEGLELNFYPEVKKYIELRKIIKQLKVKSVNFELKKFLKTLKENLPYGVYSKLIQKLQQCSSQEEYYTTLMLFSQDYKNLASEFPSLNKLFEYIKANYSLNPSLLLTEEKILKNQILYSYAKKLLDKEILALYFMTDLLKDIVEFKLTPTEYRYFKDNKDLYEKLLLKYFEDVEVKDVISLLNNKDVFEFYDVNIKRNEIFYNNIISEIEKGILLSLPRSKSKNEEKFQPDISTLISSDYLYVVITGGFHTELTGYLKQKGISYVVIMPNVTRDYTENIYEELLLGKIDFSEFLFNAFAPQLLNVGLTAETAEGIVLCLLAYAVVQGKKKNELVELINSWMKNIEESGHQQEISKQIRNLKIEVLNDNMVSINGVVYKIITAKKNGEVILKDIQKVSSYNRKKERFSFFTQGIFASVFVSLGIAINSFFNPIGWLVVAAFTGRYFINLFYFIKAGLKLGPPYEIIDDFKNPSLVEETTEPSWHTPAYVKDGKIYINSSILKYLPPRLQRSIFKHEINHLLLQHKYKSSILREMLITLREIKSFYGYFEKLFSKFLPSKKLSIRTALKLIDKHPPKLLVCDIGGTLTPDSNSTIKDGPESLLKSFLFLLKVGVPVVLLTTGSLDRAQRDVLNFLPQQVQKNIIVYAENGSLVFKDGNVVRDERFSEKERKEVESVLQDVINRLNVASIVSVREKDKEIPTGKIVLEISTKDKDITKTVYAEIEKELKNRGLNFAVWWSENKVSIGKFSKADAIEMICEELGYTEKEIMYIGNSFEKGQDESHILNTGVTAVDVSGQQQGLYKVFKRIATRVGTKYIYLFKDLSNIEQTLVYSKFKLGEKEALEKVSSLIIELISETIGKEITNKNEWLVTAHEPREVDRSICIVAKKVAEKLGIEFVSIKRRHKEITIPYAELAEEERIVRAKESLVVDEEKVKGKKVIFLDDLIVTCTFIEEVVSYLTQFGVDSIYPFSLAYLTKRKLEQKLNKISVEYDSKILVDIAKGEIFTTKFLEVIFEISKRDFKEIVKELNELQKIRLALYLVARKYSFKKKRYEKLNILIEEIRDSNVKSLLAELINGDKEIQSKKAEIVSECLKYRRIYNESELNLTLSEISEKIREIFGKRQVSDNLSQINNEKSSQVSIVPTGGLFSKDVDTIISEIVSEREQVYKISQNWAPAVVVFGSARLKEDSQPWQDAYNLGKLLYEKGYYVRTGAGPGIMEAVLKGYVEARGYEGSPRTQGVRIVVPFEKKVTPYVENVVYCKHLITRKLGLYQNSLCIVAFPGGYGTIDEIFEIWHRRKNFVLYGRNFYEDIVKILYKSWQKVGIIQPQPYIVDDINELSEIIDIISKESPNLYKNTPQEVKSANKELETGLRTLYLWPPAVVLVGSPQKDSIDLRNVEILVERLLLNNIPVRIASRYPLSEVVIKTAKKLNKEHLVQAIFNVATEPLTELEEQVKNKITTSHPSVQEVLLTENSLCNIFFVGGVGTFKKLFGLLCSIQTGTVYRRPIYVFGRNFWQPIKNVIDNKLLYYKMISQENTKLWEVVGIEDIPKIIDSIGKFLGTIFGSTKNIDNFVSSQEMGEDGIVSKFVPVENLSAYVSDAVRISLSPINKLNRTSTDALVDGEYEWIKQNAKELYGKTFIHVSPGFKPTEDFLSAFSDEEMRVRVANAHQTGGLEPLVTEELVQLTDLGMNAIGVSLLYHYVPMQRDDGSIEMRPVDYKEAINKGKLVHLGKILVPIYGVDEVVNVYAGIFKAPNTNKNAVVLFLDHPEITTEIYPSYEQREKQMLLLGRGTLAILKELQEGNPEFKEKLLNLGLPFDKIEPVIVQLNEALTTFAHPKVVIDRFTNDEFLNSLVYGFTTHTPVEAGLQKTPIENVNRIRFNPELWQYGIVRDGQIDLTKICLSVCDVVNGVSKEHAEVTERKLYPEFRGLIAGIVSGVNLAHWQRQEFKELVGKEYSKENIKKMWEIHRQAKERFAEWVAHKVGIKPDTSKLFVVEARRKTNFKSVDSFIKAMRDPQLRERFLSTEVVQILLGKPHIADKCGLARVRELIALQEGRIIEVDGTTLQEKELARDPRLIGRIIFIPNLNVAEAPIIFQGADVLCMWSELETEASATGYMKGLSNAIPTMTTKTGGPLEHIIDGYNGFFIEHYTPDRRPSPLGLIEVFEKFSDVYKRSIGEINRWNFDVDWIKMMWNALQTTPQVDVTNVVKRYIKELWLPAYRLKSVVHVDRLDKEVSDALAFTRTRLACSLPIFGLRNSQNRYGIGKITDLIEVFDRMLKPAGVNTILLLPHFTPLDESPYAAVSVYAINELYIDWVKEAQRIGLPKKIISEIKTKLEAVESEVINYEVLRDVEFEVAKVVYKHFLDRRDRKFESFKQKNSFWLDNYSRFMAAYKIVGRYPTSVDEINEIATKNPGIFDTYKSLYEYMQYVAYTQLNETIRYLHQQGCKLMFDFPFFRGKDGCDVVFNRRYFYNRSPYIWGQHWTDLVLYNWDELAADRYRLLTNPLIHWLKFGFDGVRLDALHFAYPLPHLGHNIVQSGNERGDDFVSEVITRIRSVRPDAIIVAEAFEGKDGYLREKYGIYTIANVDWFNEQDLKNIRSDKVWLQITSHDSPRIQDNPGITHKYNVEYNETSFKNFFNKVLTSGVEYVSFVIGDQWGEKTPVKEVVDGRSLWRYRISLPAERSFDISEFIKTVISQTTSKTTQGYFMKGYVVGQNIEIDANKATQILTMLRNVSMEHFKLMYDEGRKELPFGDINAPHLHSLLVSYQWMMFVGEQGKWSLLHHSYHNDFFRKLYDILNKAGITQESFPEIYTYIKQLNRLASAAVSVEEKANINIQLFGFIQGLLENILYQEYMSTTRKEVKQNKDVFAKLLLAADSFVVRDKDGEVKILAGYPWFNQSWGRDTFISLTGLLITTGRFKEAKEVFRYYAKHQRDGIIPNRIWPDGKAEYNTADASLWFVEALYRYYEITKDKEFMEEMLPVINRILYAYTSTDRTKPIYMDDDGLVVSPAQWTWMDAAPNGKPVTPRNGKPVEIQALFYNALKIAAKFNRLLGNSEIAARYENIAAQVKISINNKYFADGRVYPYDVIDGDPHKDAVRPNALMLVSLSNVDDLLDDSRKHNIVKVVENELLTPVGLRTLSPVDPKYRGDYQTFAPMEVKDQAYHQGTVWPWLVREYIFAKLKLLEDRPYDEAVEMISSNINNLVYFVRSNGTIPEVFSGNVPHSQGGCVSQAWSVAAILEILDLISTDRSKPIIEEKELKQIFSVETIKQVLSSV
ncbi:MAG: 4-alpha-glucanotransferase [Endomicrobia bacterium]|nr:4-alpha-glucanotransferase [Endomicrobiia bacterium]MDW8055775.1 4-alpha-glucanotransferase [Elusimicrobiota bacterium]